MYRENIQKNVLLIVEILKKYVYEKKALWKIIVACYSKNSM